MADEAHSLFSASGSDAWGGSCPGKPAMEDGRKVSSPYADKGTAGHTLASWVMQDRIDGGSKTARDFLGRKITVERDGGKRVFTVDQEMADHIDEYVDRFFLYTNAVGAERVCEYKVFYHEHLGVPKALAWGTMDGGAILFDQPELEHEGRIYPAGDELQGHDLKMGHGVLVTADTMQLRLYVAGLYWTFAHLGNFTRVRLVIHQPPKDHLDEIVLTIDELLTEVARLRPAVPFVIEAWELAKALRAEGVPDLKVGEQLYARGLLGTSDKACRFCDAQAVCPAMIADVSEAVTGHRASAEDFEDLTVDTPAEVKEYGGNYLAAAYLMLDRIEKWSHSVRAEIDRRVLLKGEHFDVCKVVAGKKGRREYVDQGEAELFASRLPAPLRELMFKKVLLTPAQAEKALKTSPNTWAKLCALITQSEGKPAVVPLSDKRQAISHKAAVHDFEDLTATQQPARVSGAAVGRDRHPFR